jgi:ABC-type branched-subunit amino acid transport system substrate-binding protein
MKAFLRHSNPLFSRFVPQGKNRIPQGKKNGFLRPAAMLAALGWLAACAGQQQAPAPIGVPEPRPGQSAHLPTPRPRPVPPPAEVKPAVSQPLVKVAFLVPLSGPSANIGQALLDAGTLALFDMYQGTTAEKMPKVVILPKDTGDSTAGALQAMQSALKEDISLVIGPLFSSSVSAVAPLANQKGLNILAFSNNPAVAGKGVFLLGFLPGEQARRIAEYAAESGKRNAAILAPDNEYGDTVVRAFEHRIQAAGGGVSAKEFYAPNATNFTEQAQRLGDQLRPGDNQKGFEALFLPEGGQPLQTVLSQLQQYDIHSGTVQLLGTGLWDDPRVLNYPELHGAWFASAPPERFQRFERNFVGNYGYTPPRIAGLAYDMMALAVTLAAHQGGSQPFTLQALTNPAGFDGPANGLFRCRADGICERGLAVLEVTASGFRTLKPAPAAFR